MTTLIRANISKRNPYYISKDRFYELKHFCYQYPEWIKEKNCIRLSNTRSITHPSESSGDDIVSSAAIKSASLDKKIELVFASAVEADSELYSWILKGTTEGVPYTALQMVYGIPCCKETYYDRYRKFFWILSEKKD